MPRCSRNGLIRQIEFLRAENQRLPKRVSKHGIRLDQEVRTRLIKLGQAVGPSLHKLITIVAPSTYRRWMLNLEKQTAEKADGTPPDGSSDP